MLFEVTTGVAVDLAVGFAVVVVVVVVVVLVAVVVVALSPNQLLETNLQDHNFRLWNRRGLAQIN